MGNNYVIYYDVGWLQHDLSVMCQSDTATRVSFYFPYECTTTQSVIMNQTKNVTHYKGTMIYGNVGNDHANNFV